MSPDFGSGKLDGKRVTDKMYLDHDAEVLARKLGDPVPSDEDMLKYGPLGAVAEPYRRKYVMKESLQECISRNLRGMYTTFGYGSHRNGN